jgi:FixJ family two-component response regulator
METMKERDTVPAENGAMRSAPVPSTVFIVDDDHGVRKSLRWLVGSVGLPVETYGSARDFLDSFDPDRPGCLVVDVRMPGMSGPDLQEELKSRNATLPIIFITGYGDVQTAVRTLRNGAADFIEKPFSNQLLLDRIQRAIEFDQAERHRLAEHSRVAARASRLTPREREVVDLVAAGKPSKMIAVDLGVSEKTVEFHRSNIMNKLGARSLADLLRVVHLMRSGERTPQMVR